MTSDIDQIFRSWASLCSEIGGPSQTARYRIGGTSKFGVYLAICFEPLSPVLEFGPISPDLVKDNPLPSIKGIESGLSFRSNELFLTLSLRQAASIDIFLTLAARLTDELGHVEYPVTGYNAIRKVLVVWQTFFASERGVLSGPEQIGLAGELILIALLVEKGVGESSVIRSWKGSEKSHHDFHLPFATIEAKATIAHNIDAISISSLHQLDDTGTKKLFLAQVVMDSHDHGIHTLPLLVKNIRERLSAHLADRLEFEEKLLQADYRDTDEPHYMKQSFVTRKVRVFPVDESFPKLTSTSVPGDVLEASYKISLGSVARHAVSFDDFISAVLSENND